MLLGKENSAAILDQLQKFHLDLEFSVGIWYFSPSGSRFRETDQAIPIEVRLEKIASLQDYGVNAIEAHYPNEINDENIDLYKSFVKDTGIRVITVIPNLFFQLQWEFSSLASPLEDIRQKAIQRLIRTLELNRELETDFCVIWPGSDGYENTFGIDFIDMRKRFAEGIAEALDQVPKVKIAIEPKPYEPRGRIIYGTTAEGLLLAEKVEGLLENEENTKMLQEGKTIVGLNPEVGHVHMAGEDLPYAFSLGLEYGRLFHTHWNSQPLGNFDQDQNVGLISPEQAEAALYMLKMHGYRGYFGLDINPERMPVERAVKNNIDALRSMNERIERLDHERILECVNRPDLNRGILEAILIRARAPIGTNLPKF